MISSSVNKGDLAHGITSFTVFSRRGREGSITGAARFLHVTQPTLSRQLKDLEDELGQKLFTRGKHHVRLTAEGRLLQKRAEEIMDMVGKTESEFSSMGSIVGGDVYIGGGESDAMTLIANVIRELRDDYPHIRYHLYSGNAEDVTERLNKGVLDFGILIQPVDISQYAYINLPAKDVWGVVMRKDSPLAAKKSITLNQLLNVPLICSKQVVRRMAGQNEYAQWFGATWGKLNVVATFNLIYNAALMVKAGIGYAISLDKLTDVSEHSSLCFRPLKPRLESGLNIVWKKHQVFSRAAEIFLERLQKKFGAKKTDA